MIRATCPRTVCAYCEAVPSLSWEKYADGVIIGKSKFDFLGIEAPPFTLHVLSVHSSLAVRGF